MWTLSLSRFVLEAPAARRALDRLAHDHAQAQTINGCIGS
jgi:hypothetical protein